MRSSRNKKSSYRPQFELLEQRLPLTTSVMLSGSTLTINGDNTRNVVGILDKGSFVRVVTDSSPPTNFTNVTRIVLKLKGGNDKLTYSAPDLALNSATRSIAAALGPAGTSASSANVASFNFGELKGTNLNLKITGGNQEDKVAVSFGKINTAAKVSVIANLKAGVDQSSVSFTDSISQAGTDVSSQYNLGTGNNDFTTNLGSGASFVNNNSGQAFRHTVIGSDDPADSDQIRAFLRGRVDSDFEYNVLLGAGDDSSSLGISYNTAGAFGVVAFGGHLKVLMDGGDGDDELIVNHSLANGTVSTGGNSAFVFSSGSLLDISLIGGRGDDEIFCDFGDGGLEVDAGARFQVRLFGDYGFDNATAPGNDLIIATFDFAPSSNSSTASDVDIQLSGDDGDDSLSLSVDNDATTPFRSLRTKIDGGAGTDQGFGNPTIKRRVEN